MDFRQTTQPNNSRPAPTNALPEAPEHREDKKPHDKMKTPSWYQLFNGVILVGIAILVGGIAVGLSRSHTTKTVAESTYVNTSKYQAVFLNNGQYYFGNITNMTDNYIRLANIYYLTQSGTDANSNYSLIKLGCQQIHDPYDAMVINRSEISFWENLQDDGKVVKSIKQFIQQNPKGPDCTQVSNQTQAASGTTQGTSTDTTKK